MLTVLECCITSCANPKRCLTFWRHTFVKHVKSRNHVFWHKIHNGTSKAVCLLAELQICCQTAADVSFLLKRCSQVVEHQLLDAAFTLRVLAQRHHSRLQA